VWRIGGVTLVDAGALTVGDAPCAVTVDVGMRTITPLGIADGRVTAAAPHRLT
jgi:hypothetical protein